LEIKKLVNHQSLLNIYQKKL